MKVLLSLLLLLLSGIPLAAQFDEPERGDLYFPPKLTIGVSQDMSLLSSMYTGAEPTTPPEPASEIIMQKRIEERNTYSPLPMIFFDPASSVLPERYQQFTSSFDADSYTEKAEIDETYTLGSTDLKYREILDILGYRLGQWDTARISIQGGYSTEPGENEEIARERADVINEYLQRIWRVDSSRITILPPRRFADSSDHILAQEEARSVRIYPDTWELLQRVYYPTSSIDMSGLTLHIGLAPNIPRSEIASARLVIASGDDILGETVLAIPEGEEHAPISWTGMWFIPRRVTTIEEPLSINLLVATRAGDVRASNTVTIPVRIVEPEEDEDEVTYEEDLSEYMEEAGYEGDVYYESYEVPADETTDWERYYFDEIYYFNSGDTTLDHLQRMYVDARIREISKRLSHDTTTPWRLEVDATGDATEDPEVNATYLQTGRSIYQSSSNFYVDLLDDPDFQISLYIMPEITVESETDQQRMVDDLIEQMYGERAEEIKQVQEDSRTIFLNNADESGIDKERIDRVFLARAASVARYLTSKLDTSQMDTVLLKSSDAYRINRIRWSPEERIAQRTATIRIITPDQWEWEMDEEEEEEMIYDAGFQDVEGEDREDEVGVEEVEPVEEE